jgi:hypothetical protein
LITEIKCPMTTKKEEMPIQALLSFGWIVAGILLCVSLFAFDYILCFEFQRELLASLSWRSVGFLSVAILAECLLFRLSAKTKTLSASIVSLLVCLTLVGFGIEISGFPNIPPAGTGRFSEWVYNQPWYKFSLLVLFFLPLVFWGCHTLKNRKRK